MPITARFRPRKADSATLLMEYVSNLVSARNAEGPPRIEKGY